MSKNESKHTPGPWIASETQSKFGSWGVFTKGAMYSVLDGSAPHGQAEANARLIAAAPELLEALRKLSNIIGEALPESSNYDRRDGTPLLCEGDVIALESARAAIAKAEGRE